MLCIYFAMLATCILAWSTNGLFVFVLIKQHLEIKIQHIVINKVNVTSHKTKTCTQSRLFQFRIEKNDTKCIYSACINKISPYALARTCTHLRRNYETIITVLIYHNALHATQNFWMNYIYGFNQGHYLFFDTGSISTITFNEQFHKV